jgi:WhiB family redox-sensing transcriptional regulator
MAEPKMDWRHHAACRTENPELFFPVGHAGPAEIQIEEAKQVCRRCDVREECLAWAIEMDMDHGVWGGLSEDERRALKRRNARARIGTYAAAELTPDQVTVRIPDSKTGHS